MLGFGAWKGDWRLGAETGAWEPGLEPRGAKNEVSGTQKQVRVFEAALINAYLAWFAGQKFHPITYI